MLKRIFAMALSLMLLITFSVPASASSVDEDFITGGVSSDNANLTYDERYVLGNVVTFEEINAKSVASPTAISELVWLSGYDNFSWLASNDFSQFTQGSGDANCVPTAIANVFSYFNANGVPMFSGDFTQGMYDNLCNLLKFDPNNGTYWKNQKPAIVSFASQYGRTAKVDNYWLNLWSDITRDIKANKPIILSVHSGNTGHVTMIVGYYVQDGVKKVICLSGYNSEYLIEYVYNSSTFTMQSVAIS